MWRDFDFDLIVIFGIPLLLIGAIVFLMYVGIQKDIEKAELQQACVDAGGSYVISYVPLKGFKDNKACIKDYVIVETK